MSTDVRADLTLTHVESGAEIAVWDERGTLVVHAPSVRSMHALWDAFERFPFREVDDRQLLSEIGVPIELRVRHATVARVPADGTRPFLRPGSGVEIDWSGVIAACWRSLLQ